MSTLTPDVSAFIRDIDICPVQKAIGALEDKQLAVNITAALQLPNASPTKIADALNVTESAVRRHMRQRCRCQHKATP